MWNAVEQHNWGGTYILPCSLRIKVPVDSSVEQWLTGTCSYLPFDTEKWLTKLRNKLNTILQYQLFVNLHKDTDQYATLVTRGSKYDQQLQQLTSLIAVNRICQHVDSFMLTKTEPMVPQPVTCMPPRQDMLDNIVRIITRVLVIIENALQSQRHRAAIQARAKVDIQLLFDQLRL